MNEQTELQRKGQAAKQASRKLAVLDTNTKNKALMAMADALLAKQEAILKANEIDLANAEAKGTSKALMDRLRLTDKRLADMGHDSHFGFLPYFHFWVSSDLGIYLFCNQAEYQEAQ